MSNTPTPEDINRANFEQATWDYYQELKARGWSSDVEGDSSRPESLFWRKPNGMYGIKQIHAAFNGWNLRIRADNAATINVLERFEPLVQAALGLIKEVGRRVDEEEVPAKYTTPYGHVNALCRALGLAQVEAPDTAAGLQPMASAPKDEFILLCCPSGYTTTPFVFTTGIMHSDYKQGRWVDHANDDLTDWGMVPVSWTPLPKVTP